MTISTGARAALVAALLLVAACPRLPPPERRPRARLVAFERAGSLLAARLAIEGAGPLLPIAVDWALAVGERDIARARTDTLEVRMPLPARVGAGTLVRLRGAVHLEGGGRTAIAPFDELARVP